MKLKLLDQVRQGDILLELVEVIPTGVKTDKPIGWLLRRGRAKDGNQKEHFDKWAHAFLPVVFQKSSLDIQPPRRAKVKPIRE